MVICSVQVHGGVTNDVIKAAVNEARALAKRNEDFDKNVHTVLFFDEVNTTESLELIKEVMCDRRLNGKPIVENIKFAAACNPYRRQATIIRIRDSLHMHIILVLEKKT